MKPSNMLKIRKYSWITLTLVVILGLSSCVQYSTSGGSGGGWTPLPQTLQLEFRQVNIFHFTWLDIADETEYRLLEDIDGQSGYSVIAYISANRTSYDLYVPLPDHINSVYMLQALRGGSYQSMGVVAVTGEAYAGRIGGDHRMAEQQLAQLGKDEAHLVWRRLVAQL